MPKVICNKMLFNNELNLKYIFKQFDNGFVEVTVIGPHKGGWIIYSKSTIPVGSNIPSTSYVSNNLF